MILIITRLVVKSESINASEQLIDTASGHVNTAINP